MMKSLKEIWKYLYRKIKSSFKLVSIFILTFILLFVIVPYIDMQLTNGDLYGRLIDTQEANHFGIPKEKTNKFPTIRLVFHKILSEENSIEASILLYDGDKLNGNNFDAIIRDGYLNNPFDIQNTLSQIDIALFDNNGALTKAFQSKRFFIPITQSVSGFPNDKILIYPLVSLYVDEKYTRDFNFEVQKTIPGRLMNLRVEDGNSVKIELIRTPLEKKFVFVSSAIFVLISIMLGYRLIISKTGLTKLEEIFMVASYIIAIAGFRELIGLTRVTGISALEIIVIGVPLVLIFCAVVISFIKGFHSKNLLK